MIVLLATLSRAPAVISAIRNKQPDALWVIATNESQAEVAAIYDGLETAGLIKPTLLGTTVTAHDDLRQIHTDTLEALKQIRQLEPHAALHIELTGGTVPMSLGVWEASKQRADALVTWTDFAARNRVHILSLPKTA